ncbi:MAG: glycosyltransferase [Bacteroidales bacterium]
MAEGLAMYWILIPIIPYFILFMILCAVQYRDGKSSGPAQADSEFLPGREKPTLSVIIPVRNESHNIERIAGDLAGQDYPRNLTEIIIIDDNSSDNSYEIALKSVVSLAGCKVARNNGKGKKDAIATGIALSSSGYIVTTDADCTLQAGWLSSIAATISRDHPDLIIGPVYPLPAKGIASLLMQLEFLSVQSVTEASARVGRPVMAGVQTWPSLDPWQKATRNLYTRILARAMICSCCNRQKDGEESCFSMIPRGCGHDCDARDNQGILLPANALERQIRKGTPIPTF